MTTSFEIARRAVRSALRHPLYSAFAIVSLAVTIGGGTLLFSLYDAIVFRPLSVTRPAELVSVRELGVDSNGQSSDLGRVSLADFEEMRAASSSLADLGAYAFGEAIVRAGGTAERVEVQWVSPRYFDVLGVHAVRGRTFARGDDPRRGGLGGVVLGVAAWSRLFGRDPNVAGKTIELDGIPTPILGVAPADFHGFEVGANPALFALASQAPSNWAFFHLFARLHPGVSPAAVETKLAAAHDAIRAREPNRQSFMIVDGKSSRASERIQVVDGSRGESGLRGDATLPIALVGGLLGLVLIVLAANLANLLAVRALSERRTAAIRYALGASRSTIVGGWLAESLLLTFVGAGLGIAVAEYTGDALLGLAPIPLWARGLSPSLDARSAAVAVLVSLFVSLLVGGFAAWEQSRITPALGLREQSPSTTETRSGVRWRNALIASQVALAVVLLVAMGLFVRSAAALLDIDTGFPLERVVTLQIDFPETMANRISTKLTGIRESLAHLPGVVDAGFSNNPLLGGVLGYRMASVEGYEPKADEIVMLNTVGVSPGFIETLELPLASGRSFRDSEERDPVRTVVVNRRFADHYFAGEDPLGHRLSFNFERGDWSKPEDGDLTIVGVVDDRMISNVREKPTPRVYALADHPPTSVNFYVRTVGNPMRIASMIGDLLRERAPDAAVSRIHTLADQRNRSIRRDLLTRDLALVFGGFAVVLAALGLFAVLSYLVGERRRELALRQALGATPADLVRKVVADGARPMLWGLVAGLGIAVTASRFAASQLYGVTPRDPVAFFGALGLMAAVSFVACLLPALRAARVDPARALRSE